MTSALFQFNRRRLLAAGAATLVTRVPAFAADKVRVGKAISSSFPFAGLELAQQQGMWASEGIEAEITVFQGDGRMQQGFAAGAIDFGVGSGPGMGYAAKGVPARAVAVLANQPQNMCVVVSNTSGVKTVDDLKGKRLGVTTAGSLTDWLARRLSDSRGWGKDGIDVIPMGDMRTRLAAMKSGDLVGSVNSIQEGYNLEANGAGHVLVTFGEAVPNFHTHVIFASDALIQKNPDLVRRFLRAWFKTAAFMRDDRKKTVASIAKTMQLSEKIVDESYPNELGMLSFDGAFSDKAVDVIRHSLKDLGITDSVPDPKDMFTTQFVPVKV